MNTKAKLLGLIAFSAIFSCHGMEPVGEWSEEEMLLLFPAQRVQTPSPEEPKPSKGESRRKKIENKEFVLKVTNSTTQKYYGRLVDFSNWDTGSFFGKNEYLLLDKYEVDPGKTIHIKFLKSEFPFSKEKRAKMHQRREKDHRRGGGYFYYSPIEEKITTTDIENYDIPWGRENLNFEEINTEKRDEQSIVISRESDNERLFNAVERGDSESSYYRILGVPVNATRAEIEKAFENRIQPYITESRPSLKHRELQKAYMTLIDPKKRAAYDRTLIKREFIRE